MKHNDAHRAMRTVWGTHQAVDVPKPTLAPRPDGLVLQQSHGRGEQALTSEKGTTNNNIGS